MIAGTVLDPKTQKLIDEYNKQRFTELLRLKNENTAKDIK